MDTQPQAAASLQHTLTKRVARFADRVADWDAFAGASGKHDDATVIPAEHFTLSVMFVPVGQGSPAHAHEVEEVLFLLKGRVMVFFEDGQGNRAEAVLGPWDCFSAPANVIHGYHNVGAEPAYLQIMLGKARPDLPDYADQDLRDRRDEHLKSPR